MMDTQARDSVIGLGYLSRYVVTIDGPRSTMYLRPGKNFNRLDRYDLSGVSFARLDERMVAITAVAPNSAGESAGLREVDEIISIDGARPGHTSYFELARLLTLPGKRRMVIQRVYDRKEVTLVLEDVTDDGAAQSGR